MSYKISLSKSWRPGEWHPSGYSLLFHPGEYRVPEDMSEAMAARAVEEADAKMILPPSEEPGEVPRRKMRHGAPENKTR